MHLFLSILAIVSAGTTGVLYWFGLQEFYFWYYPWFDIPLHIVGGLTIGLWGASLAWRRKLSPQQSFLFLLLLTVAIGSLWEIFEYVSGLTWDKADFVFDTLGDLLGDLGGTTVAWLIYWALYPKVDTIE